MSAEAWTLMMTVVMLGGLLLLTIVGLLVHGTARVLDIVIGGPALIAVVVAASVWLYRHGPLLPGDPRSRAVRLEHQLLEGTPPPADRYCPRCGRRRFRITPFDYLPPIAAENEVLCTPMSCEWYNEPSVPAPPRPE